MTAKPTIRALADAVTPSGMRHGGVDPRESARSARALDTMGRRAFWELRHARLRLAIAENDIAWAQELLVDRSIAPDGALMMLEEIMEELAGVRP